MGHDIHQYYFERYLRNEMSIRDRLDFENKLVADSRMRSSFEHYKLNRQEYLSDFAIRQQRKASHRRLNSWIYLLVSVIGLLWSINLYLDNQLLRSAQQVVMVDSVPFLQRIPFLFGRKTEKKSDNTPIIQQPVINDTTSHSDSTLLVPELPFDQDVLIADTLMRVYDRSDFEEHYQKLIAGHDSISTDSQLARLTLMEIENDKPAGMVIVEYWKSPINYIGYKFNGKKLMIYGYQDPIPLTLLRMNNETGIRQDEGNIFNLINDNNFHPF